jgi:hypothetical protein
VTPDGASVALDPMLQAERDSMKIANKEKRMILFIFIIPFFA